MCVKSSPEQPCRTPPDASAQTRWRIPRREGGGLVIRCLRRAWRATSLRPQAIHALRQEPISGPHGAANRLHISLNPPPSVFSTSRRSGSAPRRCSWAFRIPVGAVFLRLSQAFLTFVLCAGFCVAIIDSGRVVLLLLRPFHLWIGRLWPVDPERHRCSESAALT